MKRLLIAGMALAALGFAVPAFAGITPFSGEGDGTTACSCTSDCTCDGNCTCTDENRCSEGCTCSDSSTCSCGTGCSAEEAPTCVAPISGCPSAGQCGMGGCGN